MNMDTMGILGLHDGAEAVDLKVDPEKLVRMATKKNRERSAKGKKKADGVDIKVKISKRAFKHME